jgi:hypothetical protein
MFDKLLTSNVFFIQNIPTTVVIPGFSTKFAQWIVILELEGAQHFLFSLRYIYSLVV